MPSACSLVDFNGHIGADPPAEGAGRAFSGIVADNVVIALFVEPFGKADYPFGAGYQAELASLASLLINRNLSHSSFLLKAYWAADQRRFAG